MRPWPLVDYISCLQIRRSCDGWLNHLHIHQARSSLSTISRAPSRKRGFPSLSRPCPNLAPTVAPLLLIMALHASFTVLYFAISDGKFQVALSMADPLPHWISCLFEPFAKEGSSRMPTSSTHARSLQPLPCSCRCCMLPKGLVHR